MSNTRILAVIFITALVTSLWCRAPVIATARAATGEADCWSTALMADPAVERKMNEEIAAGRERFVSVNPTTMRAW